MNGKKYEKIVKKIQPVTHVILDVDGVLTDGKIIIDDSGREMKHFNVRDGHGIKLLVRAGIEVMLMTGRKSAVVEHRARELGIREVYQNAWDKGTLIDTIMKTHAVNPEQVCYMGDDIVDIPAFQRVGVSIAPADAMDYVKKHSDYVTSLGGGEGAVRELCEMILRVQGKWKEITAQYGII